MGARASGRRAGLARRLRQGHLTAFQLRAVCERSTRSAIASGVSYLHEVETKRHVEDAVEQGVDPAWDPTYEQVRDAILDAANGYYAN